MILPKVSTNHDTKVRKPQLRLLGMINIDFKTSETLDLQTRWRH